MGSQVGEEGGEASNMVSMEDLKNLESRLISTLCNKIKQLHDLVEQPVKDKFASPPPPPREELPPLPKGNASALPTVVVVGDNDNTNSSTKKDGGKVEHHEVPNWYSPD